MLVIGAGAKIILTPNSNDEQGHDDHSGHAHGQDQGKSSQVTVWGDRFEIFMEHPFVVAGEPTKFVTHVSDRITLQPRRKGSVTFVLTDSSGTSQKHVDAAPARDGIYIPALTFPHSGTWDVSLNISIEEKEYVVKLPTIKVYKSQAEVDHAPASEEIVGISFLKEQQWKLPFATEAVQKHMVLSQSVTAIPESAIIYEDGKPTAFVHLAGETFQERHLKLGKMNNGFAEVLSGLSEGEYVTTKGAYAVSTGDSVVQLCEEDIKKYGIEVGSAVEGQLQVHITVPGEIAINADHLAHIVPRVSGIVQSVKKTLGDTVKQGEVMAVIESRELADIKTSYLASLGKLELAKVTLERENKLQKQQISSEQEYLNARNAFAEAKINMFSAEQKLRALGFKQEYLDTLPAEPKELLTAFEITAPFGGKVIEKHITLGELVKDDADAFVVADLDTVWIDLQVHQKDIALVKKGQDVMISSQHIPVTTGIISYVEPILNGKTRTALTRVVLDNSSGRLRPGTFVTAEVLVESLDSNLIVDKDTIQDINNLNRVFVMNTNGFEARPVTLGRSNKDKVEIISGLDLGEKIVTKNSFRLKAQLKKAAGGGHAGHGHAH